MRIHNHFLGVVLTSYASVVAADTTVSHTGGCGNGISCFGSMFGGCCSATGECGATPGHCGRGCQMKYGHCENTKGWPSPDGTCGGGNGYTCEGSEYGDCCSQHEFCGTSDAFCGTGCLSGFGDCSSSLSNSSVSTVSSSLPKSTPGTSGEKRGLVVRSDAIAKGCPNGTIFTAECGAEYWIECEVDHLGGDISWQGNGFYTETFEGCLTECSRWPNCISVAWVKSGSEGPCYIKERIGEKIALGHVWGGSLVKNCTNGASIETPPLNTPPYATPTSIASNSTTSSSASVTVTRTNVTSTVTPTPTVSPPACSSPPEPEPTEEPECIPCEGQGGSLPYCGADVFTDNYKFTPKTCRTVRYTLDITNNTVAPAGRERIALLINGQMPGPLIEANWGDTVIVTVNNKLKDNGTSIHFHGIRQLNNSEHDGVPSITQCPVAPGDSITYRFLATNYGTSWYHSHYAIQAWEGVMGPVIIHGPTSKQWGVDAGTVILQDWSQRTVDSMYDEAQDAINGGPRIMDNGLINGKNTWGVQGTVNQTGQRFELDMRFEPGKTYLFRIINGAIQSTYKFYIDGHALEVINMDFTNIEPYKTNVLNLNIGQRYMVFVKADQPVGDYWMRSDNQNACAATIQADDIKGIVRYSGSPGAIPTSTAYNYTGECVDEPLASLVPIAKINPTNKDIDFTKDVTIAANDQNLFKWYLSGTTFDSRYEDPTLMRIIANSSAPTYSGDLILDLPDMHQWVYIIIESAIPLPHPIHLHGHDFFILAAGEGPYTPGSTVLNLNNPPRRDTANMPARGFLVVAFETDNPGTWLMHCHIGWHTSMGFALQILEGKSMIKDTVKNQSALQDTCAKWDKWVEETGFKQHDSGV